MRLAEHIANSVGLRQRARIAVEDKTLLAVLLVDAFGHDRVDDLVGDELAGIHHRLGALADLRAGLNGGTKHVAGRELRDVVAFDETLCLSPLSCPWGPKQN